jgi:flagellar P-ring protein precursor FlgI
VLGLASGALYIEGTDSLTTARIPGGLTLERDIVSLFVDKSRGHVVTLLLEEGHATFHSSREVARVINAEFSFEAGTAQIARAIGPGTIEVKVPPTYQDSPVEFIAQVLDVGIDNPHTQARVVVNARTGTVVVTGEVEISPGLVSHRSLSIDVGGQDAGGGGGGDDGAASGRFVKLSEKQPGQSQQLDQLVAALNQLRVPTYDIVEIIRELHRSGKLHAVYEEH